VTTLAPARPAEAPLLGMLFGAKAYSVFAIHDALFKGIIHQYDVSGVLPPPSVLLAAMRFRTG
jgi:hypothetical protein